MNAKVNSVSAKDVSVSASEKSGENVEEGNAEKVEQFESASSSESVEIIEKAIIIELGSEEISKNLEDVNIEPVVEESSKPEAEESA